MAMEQLREDNVLGAFIDNNAENTVIIGAHFDHLGFGGDGSLYRDSLSKPFTTVQTTMPLVLPLC